MKIISAIPGLARTPTEHEIREFLNSRLNLQLGTVDEKGYPNIHPIWFLFENEKLYVMTGKKSKKAVNAIRQKRIYYSIDDETFPYKGVKGKADTQLLDDTSSNIKIAEKIITKYMGGLDNDIGRWILSEIRQGNEAVLEITPKYYSAWSFA